MRLPVLMYTWHSSEALYCIEFRRRCWEGFCRACAFEDIAPASVETTTLAKTPHDVPHSNGDREGV